MKCFTVQYGDVKPGIELNSRNGRPDDLCLGFDPITRSSVKFRLSKMRPPTLIDDGDRFILDDAFPERCNSERPFGVLAAPQKTGTSALVLVDTGSPRAEVEINGMVFSKDASPVMIDFGIRDANRRDVTMAKSSMYLVVLKDGDSIHVQIRGGGHFVVKNTLGNVHSHEVDSHGELDTPYPSRFLGSIPKVSPTVALESRTAVMGPQSAIVFDGHTKVVEAPNRAQIEAEAACTELSTDLETGELVESWMQV